MLNYISVTHAVKIKRSTIVTRKQFINNNIKKYFVRVNKCFFV